MSDSTVFECGTAANPPNWGVWGGFSSTLKELNEKTPLKKHTGKIRQHIGNLPENGQWEVVAQNRGWWLLIDLETSGPWMTLKLGSKVNRLGKANFKLGWNADRLAKGGDQAYLAENYPEVEEWVVANLVAYGHAQREVARVVAANV